VRCLLFFESFLRAAPLRFINFLTKNLLSAELYSSAKNMAKFRNVVVHHYDKVDADIVVAILRKNLDDFLNYGDAVLSFLKSEQAH